MFARIRRTRKLAGTAIQVVKQVPLLRDLLKDCWAKKYRISWRTRIAVSLALAYFLMPFDLIPDFIPVIGHLDDAFVLGFLLRRIQGDLRAYAVWKGLNPSDYAL